MQKKKHVHNPRLRRAGRFALITTMLMVVLIFSIAVWLDPYDAKGRPRRSETHTQLGLAKCSFKVLTNRPCPSCGMTTSFALFVRGDLVNACKANAVGVMLAVVLVLIIPWSLTCIIRGRLIGFPSWQRAVLLLAVGFMVLTMTRWMIVVGFDWIFS